METTPLLEVRDLVVELRVEGGTIRAVDGVSFALAAGETMGLVGESGCGKSTVALAILRLVPDPPGEICAGKVLFRGEDLLRADGRRLREVRGNQISMVFQEPMTALNPVLTVGEQVAEAIRLHRGLDRRAALARTEELFRQVGFPSTEQVRAYPHQLSGGQRQRVVLAMALACEPAVLLADEPTTALDVTLQAQVLELLGQAQRAAGMALVLITHDLGLVAERCARVVVLYAGQVVESAATPELFAEPRHPYTAALLAAARALGRTPGTALPEIPGSLPDPRRLPPGCRFAERCARAQADCRAAALPLVSLDGGRELRCLHPLQGAARNGGPEPVSSSGAPEGEGK